MKLTKSWIENNIPYITGEVEGKRILKRKIQLTRQEFTDGVRCDVSGRMIVRGDLCGKLSIARAGYGTYYISIQELIATGLDIKIQLDPDDKIIQDVKNPSGFMSYSEDLKTKLVLAKKENEEFIRKLKSDLKKAIDDKDRITQALSGICKVIELGDLIK